MTALRTPLRLTAVLARVTPIWHVVGAGLLAVWLVLQTHRDPFLDQLRATASVRTALIVLALGTAFALDDPTEHDLAGTPVSVATRRVIRVGLLLVPVALLWAGILAIASAAPALSGGPAAVLGAGAWAEMNGGTAPVFTPPPDTATLLPWAALTLELGAVLAVVLGVAAWGSRRSADRSGGLVAAPVTLAVVLVLALLPQPITFLPGWAASPLTTGTATEGWEVWVAGHQRIAVVGLAGLALLVSGSRDLARRTLRRRVAGSRVQAEPLRAADALG